MNIFRLVKDKQNVMLNRGSQTAMTYQMYLTNHYYLNSFMHNKI